MLDGRVRKRTARRDEQKAREPPRHRYQLLVLIVVSVGQPTLLPSFCWLVFLPLASFLFLLLAAIELVPMLKSKQRPANSQANRQKDKQRDGKTDGQT